MPARTSRISASAWSRYPRPKTVELLRRRSRVAPKASLRSVCLPRAVQDCRLDEDVAAENDLVDSDVLLQAVQAGASRAEDDGRDPGRAEDGRIGPEAHSLSADRTPGGSEYGCQIFDDQAPHGSRIRRLRKQGTGRGAERGILPRERREDGVDLGERAVGCLARQSPALELQDASIRIGRELASAMDERGVER